MDRFLSFSNYESKRNQPHHPFSGPDIIYQPFGPSNLSVNKKAHDETVMGFCCRGRSRTSTGTLAAAQDCRRRYLQPTGGQPQSVRTSADRRYAVFIRNPPPPRQEGMSAKISSPHSVKSRDTSDQQDKIRQIALNGQNNSNNICK